MANQAVFADPASNEKLTIREASMPQPRHNEALIKVAAISLNRGGTHY